MKVLCIFVSMVVASRANYHEEIGIPLAASIKEYEDKLFPEGREMKYRAAGGEIVKEGAHPHLAALIISLQNGKTSMCAASLLSVNHLVTIAQCVDGAKTIEVVLGSLYVYRGGTRIKTTEFQKHPLFNKNLDLDYDIAKIKLPQDVKFSDTIQLVHLPSGLEEFEVIGEYGTAAGWGLTTDEVYFWSTNTQISQVRLMIISDTVCKESYKVSFQPYNNICTSGEGGVGMCKGDAGAPLVVMRSGRTILVGISSYGPRLCQAGHPDAFTRIATFVDYIKSWELPLN